MGRFIKKKLGITVLEEKLAELEKKQKDAEEKFNKTIDDIGEKIKAQYSVLEEKAVKLEERVKELEKPTISKATTKDEELPSASQILNEWLNGEE